MKKLIKTSIFEEYSTVDCEYWFRDVGTCGEYTVSGTVGYFSMIDEKPEDIGLDWEETMATNVNFVI